MNTAPYNLSAFVPAAPIAADPAKEKIANLKTAVLFLNPRDRIFAESLLKQYAERGSLSEKQMYWVSKLALVGHPAPVAAPAPAAPPISTQLANGFNQVVALFDRAQAAGLAFPKIRLETEDGTKVVLRRLGASSNSPGFISVTDAGKSFQTRRYFGKVSPQGTFFGAPATTPGVAKLLQDLARDSAGTAALYGHKHSSCCFCGLELKTRESVAMGYGPICAQKFGLPWGQVAPSTLVCLTPENTNDTP